ncbi:MULTISPECIES: outer membrane protein [Hyphomicrobiales]|uniref:outer membrane protein n=1 Tax=Hyphomicrobiales TaxID=356 RepID=UPI001FDA02ED|nr:MULTISPECIES: outer membrane protein [Phyllobacteriaceae]MCX8568772.1 porin family protein [Aminobacter sp. MET-1]
MKKSARITIVYSMMILGLSSAQAADVISEQTPSPVAERFAYDWSGLHVGVHGGIGGGTFDNSYIIETEVGPIGYYVSDRAFGGFGGFQVGYNRQFASNWVAGVEADLSLSEIKAEHSESTEGFSSRYTVQVDWFGTVRGRLGYAEENVLFYGTGGAAYGKISYSDSDSDGFSEALSDTNLGWTAGAGVEYGITDNVTLKTEYLYVDLGSLKGTNLIFTGDRIEMDTAFHTLKTGLNYKF